MLDRFLDYERIKILTDIGYEDVKLFRGRIIAKKGDFIFLNLRINHNGLVIYDMMERIIPDFSIV